MGRRKKKSAAWQNSWKVRRKDWIIFLVYTNWIGSCYIPLERRKNKLYNRKKQKEIGQTQKELWIDKKQSGNIGKFLPQQNYCIWHKLLRKSSKNSEKVKNIGSQKFLHGWNFAKFSGIVEMYELKNPIQRTFYVLPLFLFKEELKWLRKRILTKKLEMLLRDKFKVVKVK